MEQQPQVHSPAVPVDVAALLLCVLALLKMMMMMMTLCVEVFHLN